MGRHVSFGTHARKVRDPALPFSRRVVALHSAVERYQPLGWHLTLRFLDQAVGGHSSSEQALLRALELLEESRRLWLAEVRAYTGRRRADKAGGGRSPRPDDPNPFRHLTGWYGPLRPAASLHALTTWRTRLSAEDPSGQEVQALAAVCIATGALTTDQAAELTSVAAGLRRRIRSAAARGDSNSEFRAMTVLRLVGLITAAARVSGEQTEAGARRRGDVVAAWEDQLAAAEADDAYRSDRSRSWVPPILAPLVATAMNSSLRRLFPFTSHNLLRFSRSPDVAMPNSADIAPAFVAVVPDPDRYVVLAGAFDAQRWHSVFETTEPVAAVAQVERVLSTSSWREDATNQPR